MVGAEDGIASPRAAKGPRLLGTLGGSQSYAKHINSRGQVVGRSFLTSDFGSAAFLYEHTKGLQNLSQLIPSGSGWSLRQALDINESGQIIGIGRFNGISHGFQLTEVPEPGNAGAGINVSAARRRPPPVTLRR